MITSACGLENQTPGKAIISDVQTVSGQVASLSQLHDPHYYYTELVFNPVLHRMPETTSPFPLMW